jgi:hypothetical protein
VVGRVAAAVHERGRCTTSKDAIPPLILDRAKSRTSSLTADFSGHTREPLVAPFAHYSRLVSSFRSLRRHDGYSARAVSNPQIDLRTGACKRRWHLPPHTARP